MGTAKDPSRIGEARVQSVRQNRRQVHAATDASKAITGLAVILKQHPATIWACDFFCVQTILFRTLYVFFVIHRASRQVLHVRVTQHPTGEWTAQQIVECCGWDNEPPRFLVHDRDNCYGISFHRRVRRVAQARTPFGSPRANAITERWVRSVRTECLDHVFIFNERHLAKVLAEYVGYFNNWRPDRSIGQRPPCAPRTRASHRSDQAGEIIAIPVLGGLRHVYQQAA
jgi:putative transposase